MSKLRRISVTITEDQFNFLLELRNAKIPTTVFMRSLLQQHMLGYGQGNGNGNGYLIKETTITIKKHQKQLITLMRPEQKRTVEMAGSAFGSELKNALKSIKFEESLLNSPESEEAPKISLN